MQERTCCSPLPSKYQSAGTALLVSKDRYLGAFLVDDLSLAGAQLLGDRSIAVGERVTLILQMPERDPMTIGGKIVREQRHLTGEKILAVAFEQPSISVATLLDQVGSGQLARA